MVSNLDNHRKKSTLESLLREGTVMITIDARHPAVRVPDHFKKSADFRLNLSFQFDLPIALEKEGIEATLTFGQNTYDCHIPWDALYIITAHSDEKARVFPSSVPADLLNINPAENTFPSEKSEPKFSVVEGDSSPDADPPPENPSSKKRGHLRLV